jgi:hypothetical protein
VDASASKRLERGTQGVKRELRSRIAALVALAGAPPAFKHVARPSQPESRALLPQQKFLAPIAPANYLPRFDMADYDAEELQHLHAAAADDDDSAQPRARPSAGKSRCPKSCDSGIMLLPLPCASEVRISVSPSTPSRRRKFFLALAAGNVAPFPLLPSQSTCRNTPALQRSPAI